MHCNMGQAKALMSGVLESGVNTCTFAVDNC